MKKETEHEASVSTGLSTTILLQVQPHGYDEYIPAGACKSLVVTQCRNVTKEERQDENGRLYFELIPGPTEITLNLERTFFDGLSLSEAFGFSTRSLEQMTSFDIQVIETDDPNFESRLLNSRSGVITTYKNCLITSMTTPIKAEDYIIIEAATIVCESMVCSRLPNRV